jgi:hypothetical protein
MLCKYGLDEEEREIIESMVSVLEVGCADEFHR